MDALTPTDLDIEDPEALRTYLRASGLTAEEDVQLRILAGGVSSRTVLVTPRAKPAFVVKQSLGKLRVASDWFSPPERIHREALGLRRLGKLAPAGTIPEVLFEDLSQHVIAMTAVPEPNRTWKEMLFSGSVAEEDFEQAARILRRIHAASFRDGTLAEMFDDRSLFESLRLEPYYRYSSRQVPAAGAFLEALIEDTLRYRLAVVHGDFSPKNILMHAGEFTLVDPEVIHYGDPAFDVGFLLTHLLAKSLHLRQSRREMLRGAERFVRIYLAEVGKLDEGIEARACRHTAACLLARVAGRSPLEYLTGQEREQQKEIALRIMNDPPERLEDMIRRFGEELDCRKSNA